MFFFGEKIDELHHPGNGRVETEGIDIQGHRFDSFVKHSQLFFCRFAVCDGRV
jgi:hypothetical protein